MTAGLNIRARLWRFTTSADDASGGALLTGTVYVDSLQSRFDMDPPNRLLRQQGIETQTTATAMIRPPGLVILEGDEYEIVTPNHPQVGERWLVQGVSNPNVHPADSRGLIELALIRQERSRTPGVQQ